MQEKAIEFLSLLSRIAKKDRNELTNVLREMAKSRKNDGRHILINKNSLEVRVVFCN